MAESITRIDDAFLAFRDQCIWLQTCFNTYRALFEGGKETEDLMAKVAPRFFMDLNEILIEHCLLQVCRLTDPAKTFGRENLTAKNIDSLLDDAGLKTPRISAASDGIAHYRSLIKDSRKQGHFTRRQGYDHVGPADRGTCGL